jgi:MFS family permease
VLFGVLADMFGRRKFYVLELVIVIFSTLGIAQGSTRIYDTGNDSNFILQHDSRSPSPKWFTLVPFLQRSGADYLLSGSIAVGCISYINACDLLDWLNDKM